MHALNRLHEPVVVSPSDTELFKRFLPKNMMPFGGVIGTEFGKLWSQDGILLKLGEREKSTLPLSRRRSVSLLEPAFEMQFPEWSLAVQEPVTIHSPGDIATPSGETYGVRRCPIVSGDFPCVVQDKYASLGEARFKRVKHLFHAGTVVFVFLMQFAQDIEDNQVRLSSLDHVFNEVLSSLSCHQEGEHHIVLMDEAHIWNVEVIPHVLKLAESLSPRGFLGVKLKIEHLFWRWAVVTHHGFAFSYPGGDIKCQKALTYLWRAKKEHITRLWNEAGYQPLKLGTRGVEIFGGGDRPNHA